VYIILHKALYPTVTIYGVKFVNKVWQ